MYSPKQNSSFIKTSLLRNNSAYSSNIQTESTTSRISLSELKNLNKLRISMNIYNRKNKLKNSSNNLNSNDVLNLTNSNIINDFSK